MFRTGLLAILIALGCTTAAAAGNPAGLSATGRNEIAQAAQAYIQNGNPDEAIKTAENRLASGRLSDHDRRDLLGLIVEAEVMRVRYRHFENVDPAIRAIDNLLKEFPRDPEADQFRWREAWLWWQSGEDKKAAQAGRDLMATDPSQAIMKNIWFMLGRIELAQRHLPMARSALLQFELLADDNSKEEATGQIWIAMIDDGEGRHDLAFKSLRRIEQQWPTIIESEPVIFATLIRLLDHHGELAEAESRAEAFLARYIRNPKAGEVSLIHADIVAADPARKSEAIREYAILANTQAETTVGRLAFLRKLMLQSRDQTDAEALRPVMAAIKKIGDENQLSVIEDESTFDLAELWARYLEETGSSATASDLTALELFDRAARGRDSRLAARARADGSAWLVKRLGEHVRKKDWLPAVTLWQRFPQLRPSPDSSPKTWLQVAHAMRMLMLFDHAEEILDQLYTANSENLRGQRIQLERARLWLDRGDRDGVSKVTHWLNTHAYTLFRPEMLLIIARMQLKQGKADTARQSLQSIAAGDLSADVRGEYWLANAETAEALKLWHVAADNWQAYRKSSGADAALGLVRQAGALFNGGDFAAARDLYEQVPEAAQDRAWNYHLAICELKTGRTSQGKLRLDMLAGGGTPDMYTGLAKLALADQTARSLMEEQR